MTERDDAVEFAAVEAANGVPIPTAEPEPGQPVDAAGHPAGDNDGSIIGLDDAGSRPADEDAGTYDPSKHNVDEVTAYLRAAGLEEQGRVLAAERDGKARKGVLSLASELLGDQPTDDDDQADDDGPRTVVDAPGLAPRELLPEQGRHVELAPVEQLDDNDDEPRKLAPVETVED